MAEKLLGYVPKTNRMPNLTMCKNKCDTKGYFFICYEKDFKNCPNLKNPVETENENK